MEHCNLFGSGQVVTFSPILNNLYHTGLSQQVQIFAQIWFISDTPWPHVASVLYAILSWFDKFNLRYFLMNSLYTLGYYNSNRYNAIKFYVGFWFTGIHIYEVVIW